MNAACRLSVLLTLTLAIALIAASCAPPVPAVVPTASPSSTRPDLLDVKVDVGGYGLRIVCSGVDSPTVVVDAAWAEPALESGNWTSIRFGVEETTRICLYDRAGLGSSDAPPAGVRTSRDDARDLHTLLVNAGVPGPYVLVGHNLGGYTAVVFADRYPDDVAGVVLVDAYHPDQWSRTLAALPAVSGNTSEPLGMIWYLNSEWIHDTGDAERMDLAASGDQVRTIRSLGDLPLVVVTGNHPQHAFPGLPADLQAELDGVWQELQLELVSLSSSSIQLVVPDAGPFIQLDAPDVITSAIVQVVERSRK